MLNQALKLLIVETDKKVIDILQKRLKYYFQEIFVCNNGEDGLNTFLSKKPDLVISAINVPGRSGIKIANKIHKLDTFARIILIPHPDEIHLLIGNLGNSVTGFLLKPLEEGHLIRYMDDEVKQIIHLKQMKFAEKEYNQSINILQVTSQATAMFFSSGFNEKTITTVMKMIGEVIEASRVYIYKNYQEEGKEFTSRVYEWCADGIMPAIGNLSVTKKHISTSGFGRWVEIMKKRRGYITGFVRNFDLIEQKRLKDHNIKSILAIPVFVNNLWWGFLGIDDCVNEKTWTDPEINALEALTYNFGAAIQKRDMDEQLIRLNLGLEKRVKERTRELEFEGAERAMAEALLKDSEEKYRMIYENATDGILLLQKGKIILVNPTMVEIIEDIPRNLIGKHFSDLVLSEYKKEVKRLFRDDTRDLLSSIFHVEVELNNKKHKWLELKPAKIDWYGEPAHLVFVSNITLRKQAETEINQLNKTLEERIKEGIKQNEHQQQFLIQKSKLESIGELSAGLAHEINQPLVSISMGLDNMLTTLNEGLTDQKYIRNKIDILFQDIDRIKQTIEHVRIFSRDQQNTTVGKVQINKVIRDALSMISRQLSEQNIELIVYESENDLKTKGNQYRLEQVILNLLSNAKYAVNEKLKITNDPAFKKQITITCEKHDDNAIISIRDNGIGIPENILPDIFNPFFTTKSEDKGTGLGLSISYGIVLEMKGNITAESKLNKYTDIKVALPLLSN